MYSCILKIGELLQLVRALKERKNVIVVVVVVVVEEDEGKGSRGGRKYRNRERAGHPLILWSNYGSNEESRLRI